MTTMRLDLGQNLRLDQKMILAPRMIQSMEILQLPIMALQERIQQELQENPVLEMREATPEERAVAAEEEPGAFDGQEQRNEAADPGKELVIDDKGGNEEDFDRLLQMNQDWDGHFNEEHRASSNRMDE